MTSISNTICVNCYTTKTTDGNSPTKSLLWSLLNIFSLVDNPNFKKSEPCDLMADIQMRKKSGMWQNDIEQEGISVECQLPTCRQTYGLHGEQVWTCSGSGWGWFLCVVRSNLNKSEHVWGVPVWWGPSWITLNMSGGVVPKWWRKRALHGDPLWTEVTDTTEYITLRNLVGGW